MKITDATRYMARAHWESGPREGPMTWQAIPRKSRDKLAERQIASLRALMDHFPNNAIIAAMKAHHAATVRRVPSKHAMRLALMAALRTIEGERE